MRQISFAMNVCQSWCLCTLSEPIESLGALDTLSAPLNSKCILNLTVGSINYAQRKPVLIIATVTCEPREAPQLGGAR
jgi:hypothetical protein